MTILNSKLLVAVAVALALGLSSVNAGDKTMVQEAANNARQEAQISTTYALSPYLKAHALNVAVQDGKVMLSGSVSDEVQKELAGAIAAAIKSKLNWSKYADGMDIVITTEAGHVVLVGNIGVVMKKSVEKSASSSSFNHGVESATNSAYKAIDHASEAASPFIDRVVVKQEK